MSAREKALRDALEALYRAHVRDTGHKNGECANCFVAREILAAPQEGEGRCCPVCHQPESHHLTIWGDGNPVRECPVDPRPVKAPAAAPTPTMRCGCREGEECCTSAGCDNAAPPPVAAPQEAPWPSIECRLCKRPLTEHTKMPVGNRFEWICLAALVAAPGAEERCEKCEIKFVWPGRDPACPKCGTGRSPGKGDDK